MAFVERTAFSAVLLITAGLITYATRALIDRGYKVSIRRLAALDALEDAVGRCAEMGRPLHYAIGWYSIKQGSDFAPQKIAGLTVLGYVSELAGRYGVPVHVSLARSEEIPMVRETVRQGYIASGHPELYKEEEIQYITDALYGYFAGVSGRLMRDKPAANIMIGPFEAEVCMFAETADRLGAIQIGGSAQTWQLPAWASVVDYCLLGEEVYAAGAYLSAEPGQQSAIMMLDWLKIILISISILGWLAFDPVTSFLKSYGG